MPFAPGGQASIAFRNEFRIPGESCTREGRERETRRTKIETFTRSQEGNKGREELGSVSHDPWTRGTCEPPAGKSWKREER